MNDCELYWYDSSCPFGPTDEESCKGKVKKRVKGIEELDWEYHGGYYFACDSCYKKTLRKVRFKKLLISKIQGIGSVYPFGDLIRTNQDIVDFGIACLIQGVYGMGKTKSAQLVSLMKENGYDLKYTGKRTDQGLRFLLTQSYKYGMQKRTRNGIEAGIRFKNHLEQIGL